MGIKKIIITILCVLFIFTSHLSSVVSTSTSLNSADLELIRFESWWSNLNNGTLYIRYLVNNSGQNYQSLDGPFYLEIAFLNNTNQTPFTYIKQPSFLDPNTWYTGETIGGCYQIFNISKPETITAVVNYNQSIPETNTENNQETTMVKNGIIIKGKVTRNINNKLTPANKVSIRRSNMTTLQSTLFISFSTDQNGDYTVCLYPNEISEKNNPYTLMFINAESYQSMVKNIKIGQEEHPFIYNVTFPEYVLKTPNKPFGRLIGIRYINHRYISFLYDRNIEKFYYKFQFDSQKYSPWINTNDKKNFIVFKHTWSEPGIHQIKVIKKNKEGLLSSWSDALLIYVI